MCRLAGVSSPAGHEALQLEQHVFDQRRTLDQQHRGRQPAEAGAHFSASVAVEKHALRDCQAVQPDGVAAALRQPDARLQAACWLEAE